LHATYTVGELQNGVADGVIVPVGVGDGVKDAVDVIVGVMLGVEVAVVEGDIVIDVVAVTLDVALGLHVPEGVGEGDDGLLVTAEVEGVANCATAGAAFESADLGSPIARPTPSETARAMTAAIAKKIAAAEREGPTTIEAHTLAGPDPFEGSCVGCATDGRCVSCDDAAMTMGLIMSFMS
jgi:hypothetical protein